MQATLPEPDRIVVAHDEDGQVGLVRRWFTDDGAEPVSEDEASTTTWST